MSPLEIQFVFIAANNMQEHRSDAPYDASFISNGELKHLVISVHKTLTHLTNRISKLGVPSNEAIARAICELTGELNHLENQPIDGFHVRHLWSLFAIPIMLIDTQLRRQNV